LLLVHLSAYQLGEICYYTLYSTVFQQQRSSILIKFCAKGILTTSFHNQLDPW